MHVEMGTPDSNHYVWNHSGFLIAPFIGIGFHYKMLFVESTYYHGLGGGGFPISKRATTTMAGLKLAF